MNIAEILKKLPVGTELYCPIFGKVKLSGLIDLEDGLYIEIKTDYEKMIFNEECKLREEGECLLFPSITVRNWNNWKEVFPEVDVLYKEEQQKHQKENKSEKFDFTTLKPFDRVLVRDSNNNEWAIELFESVNNQGYLNKYPFACMASAYKQCIPFNEETQHLLGTDELAPEHYIIWES